MVEDAVSRMTGASPYIERKYASYPPNEVFPFLDERSLGDLVRPCAAVVGEVRVELGEILAYV
jgi:hypothetical protein